jgi:hypothetical protein
LSASLTSDFGAIIHNEGVHLREQAERVVKDDAALSRAERKSRQKDLRGPIWLNPLVRAESFNAIVAAFKTVNRVKLRVTTLAYSEKFFGGYQWAPKHEMIEMTIPPFASPAEVADGITAGITAEEIERATVEGTDSAGREIRASKDVNPWVFDDQDYDKMMHGFSLDLENPATSLKAAPIVAFLITTARKPTVWPLLT